MARLGHIPARPTPPSDHFNDGTVHQAPELPDHLKSSLEAYDRVSDKRAELRAERRRRERARRVKTPEERAAKAAALAAETEAAFAAAHARGEARRAGVEAPELTKRQTKLIDKWDYVRQHGDGPGPWVEGAAYSKHRLRDGFVLAAPTLVCGKYYQPEFVEKGPLRSTYSPSMQAVAAFTAAAANRGHLVDENDVERQVLMTGDLKNDRTRPWTKLEGLDRSYIELQRKFTRGGRVEIDATFKSLRVLRRLLERCKLACLPHDIAYSQGPRGEVIHPHLWFFLAEDDAVWFDETRPECSLKARRLYDAVMLGITKRLKHIGADMAGACNPRDGKNPLDPKMHFAVFNETDYPSLSEWSHYVDVAGDRDMEIRKAVLDDSGLDRKISQPLFHGARTYAWKWLAEEQKSGKGPLHKEFRFVGADKRAFAAWIFARLCDFAETIQEGSSSDSAQIGILDAVADYVSRDWSPKAMDNYKDRGAAHELVKDLDNEHDKKSVGAFYGHKSRILNTIAACRTAVIALRAGGHAVTEQSVAELADKDPRTVKRHWSKILDSVELVGKTALWSLVGGQPGSPASTEQTSCPPAEDAYEDDLIARSIVDGELTFGTDDWCEASQNDCSACLVRGGPGWVAFAPEAQWSVNARMAAEEDSKDDDVDCDDSDETVWDDAVGMPAMPEASMPTEGIVVPVATRQEVQGIVQRSMHGPEDDVARLMRRLSEHRDVPLMSLSLAAGGTRTTVNRMESHDAGS